MMKLWILFKDLFARFTNDDLLSIGAQVAFFLFLSLSPFLIFLINIITYTPIVNLKDNIEALAALMPANAYEILRDIINQTIANSSKTLLSVGVLLALWSSNSGVTYLIRGINRAYDQEETRPFWKIIIVSLYFTLELALVIILSLILIVFGKIAVTQLFDYLGFSDEFLIIWSYIRLIIALIASTLIFISLYHNIPNRKLKYREVIPGAIFASIGWFVISIAFSFYANNFGNYPKVYGFLGGIIVLLTWMYLSSIIILIGAEINASLMFSKNGFKKQKYKRF